MVRFEIEMLDEEASPSDEDLEVDGDEFAVFGFDEIADVGVGDFGAGFRIFPAVVAGGVVAVGLEPRGDFFDGGFGAIDDKVGK